MKINIHKSESRGLANHGWLKSHHTYSFARYYNPERIGFGVLRVLNDDHIEPSMGFDTHPHENMEIISIPLNGALRHKDSMGNQYIIESGEVQVMSAGSGITHSEYNHSDTDAADFLQIWIFPDKLNIEPRYEQQRFHSGKRKNQFQLLVSPDGRQDSLSINQDAYLSLIDIEEGHSANYPLFGPDNGIYLFVLSGSLAIGDIHLDERDGAEVSDITGVNLIAVKNTQLLCIEIPL